jgi:hypothetical protein
MYISGIIVCIIAIFILVIQCPHPYMKSTSEINHKIAAVILKLTGVVTRFIVQNKDRQVDPSNKKTESWFGLSSLDSSFGNGNKGEVASSDSTVDAYSNTFKEITAADRTGNALHTAATLVSAPAAPAAPVSEPAAPAPAPAPALAPATQATGQSAEYVASNGNVRHSVVPEPIVDHNLINYVLTGNQSTPLQQTPPPMEGKESQTPILDAPKPLAPLAPLAPIPRGKA